MSPPSILLNTFIEKINKPYIDTVSKYFFVVQAAFGCNRTYLISGSKIISLAVMIYCALFYSISLYILLAKESPKDFMKPVLAFVRSLFNSLCCLIFWKRFTDFYAHLNKFDMSVGCRPLVTGGSIKNLVQLAFTTTLFIVVSIAPYYYLGKFNSILLFIATMYFSYNLELAYYGHMLSLFIPRLKLINYYIESSLSTSTFESDTLLKEYSFSKNPKNELEQPDMKKIMNIYHIIVEAYDYLIDAIKWQFLVTIVTTFIILMVHSYRISVNIMGSTDSESYFVETMLKLAIAFVVLLPLFTPCVFGDIIRNQIKKFRELLASRLYENKLDKNGRGVARALLSLTETRNLSFRLLRMLDIDISLPFKFVGLLITYLIILLQFQKVIGG